MSADKPPQSVVKIDRRVHLSFYVTIFHTITRAYGLAQETCPQHPPFCPRGYSFLSWTILHWQLQLSSQPTPGSPCTFLVVWVGYKLRHRISLLFLFFFILSYICERPLLLLLSPSFLKLLTLIVRLVCRQQNIEIHSKYYHQIGTHNVGVLFSFLRLFIFFIFRPRLPPSPPGNYSRGQKSRLLSIEASCVTILFQHRVSNVSFHFLSALSIVRASDSYSAAHLHTKFFMRFFFGL